MSRSTALRLTGIHLYPPSTRLRLPSEQLFHLSFCGYLSRILHVEQTFDYAPLYCGHKTGPKFSPALPLTIPSPVGGNMLELIEGILGDPSLGLTATDR